jgi:hypothetical protein
MFIQVGGQLEAHLEYEMHKLMIPDVPACCHTLTIIMVPTVLLSYTLTITNGP